PGDRRDAIGEQGRGSGPAGKRGAASGPAGDRHGEGDHDQADGAEDVVAGAAHCAQPLGSSSPLIRNTVTRPDRSTGWTAGSPWTQLPSGEALAVAGLLRSSSGVVIR